MASARTILLAEEDPATAGFLADNLIADGYRVLVADDKTAALELLEAQRPDLVLCDVNDDTLQLIDAVRGWRQPRRHARRERGMRRTPLRRSTPLRSAPGPVRERAALRRCPPFCFWARVGSDRSRKSSPSRRRAQYCAGDE
jgi:CheY-like chemotaxis protein